MKVFQHLKISEAIRENLFAYLQIVVGCIVGGAAYPLFLVPCSIAPGGLTGITTILNHFFGVPVGITSLLLNIPLFLVGFRAIGGSFVGRSLMATLLFSLSIDLLHLQPMTTDPLLAAIYGGVLLGFGLGLILRGGATTGGTDMVARIVHQRIPHISTAMFLFFIDCCVVVAAGLTIGASEALYALICIFLSSKVIDVVMVGFTGNKACFIFSPAWEKISGRILTELDRGATHLRAEGAYSHEERPVILCVTSRQEIAQLKSIVKQEDPMAFMFITDAHEALGEGFKRLDSD